MNLPQPTREHNGLKAVAGSDGENRVDPEPGREKSRGRLMGGVVFLALLALIFGRDIVSLVAHAIAHEIHSHIILVPLISAYLIFIQRDRMPRAYVTSWAPAIVAGLAGIAALAAARYLLTTAAPISHNDYLAFIALSLILFLATAGFLFRGVSWMREAAFAVAFLVFAIPLPDKVVDLLETGSKLASAEVASVLFNLSGTPVVRDGPIFQIPGIVLEVAQECSGIRSSWVLLITSVLASYMFLKSPWRRAVLVLFIIPLGFLRNGLRILVIGLLCVHIGPEMIHSIVHRRGGPFFFALSLIPLFLLLWGLRKAEERRSPPA